MTDRSGPIRAKVTDLFRPSLLYEGIDARPTFVIPLFLLVACVMIYTQTAVGYALPKILPALIQSSRSTESELVRAYRLMILVVSIGAPGLFVGVTAFATWVLSRATPPRPPFSLVVSLVAHASLWVGLGFLAKAGLVLATGNPQPSANLGFFLKPATPALRILMAATNPFLLLALIWTVRGLRAWGAPRPAAVLGGGVPWAAWIVGLALLGTGGGQRFAPAAPVSYEGWQTLDKGVLTVRYSPAAEDIAEETATILESFSRQLAERLGFEPRPIRVNLYGDHAELERATGEFLHVRVTGSIRGRDLLYLETPGRSLALPRDDGMRDALRYMALVQLSIPAASAPRWFVEGFAHAAAIPFSPQLEAEYVSTVRTVGVPSLDTLLDPKIFRTPQGPVLARSLVDFVAARHGRDALREILAEVIRGTSFRDALYEHTRLTTSALEIGWQESVARVVAAGSRTGGTGGAPDSAGDGELPPASGSETEGAGDGDDGFRGFRDRR